MIATITMLVSVALLTLATAGTPSAQADECSGGGSPSPSSSPSSSGGGNTPLPTGILTILPGNDPSGSASPSSSGSAKPSSSSSASNTQTTNDEQAKRAAVPVFVQQDQSCPSTITLKYSTTKKAFGGRVGSENADCRKARKVQVKKDKKGKDAIVGRTTTNTRGNYTVPSPKAKGKFYAVVAKATVEKGNQTISCGAARSKTLKR